LCNLADEVIKKNKKKDNYSSWSITDLKAVIKPLKKKEDGAFPSKKEMLLLWNKVQHQVYVPFDTNLLPMVQEGLSQESSLNDAQLTNI
jgi:hypothetical protein